MRADGIAVHLRAVTSTIERDIVVVGAGSAGAALAGTLAERGWSVALVEERSIDRAGARWVNGVPPWMLREATIEPSSGVELRGRAMAFHVVAPDDRARVEIERAPIDQVDMRMLVARVINRARQAGVLVMDRCTLSDVELNEHGRPTQIRVTRRPAPSSDDKSSTNDQMSQGAPAPVAEREPITLRARLFVDASGIGAQLASRVPSLARHLTPLHPLDRCSAAQATYEVADRDGARRTLDELRIGPGGIHCELGRWGGYSIGNISLSEDLSEVEFLTGAIADGTQPSGARILRSIRERFSWVGARIFGGSGIVPLGRTRDLFVAPGIALVGNAATQMFSASGSGVGIGLIAGRRLADALVGARDPGDLATLWRYQATFLREHGGLLAVYDDVRRAAQRLAPHEVSRLIGGGLVTPALMHAYLDQRLVFPKPRELLGMARGVMRHGSLPRPLTTTVVRIPALLAHHGLVPKSPDVEAQLRWAQRLAQLRREGWGISSAAAR